MGKSTITPEFSVEPSKSEAEVFIYLKTGSIIKFTREVAEQLRDALIKVLTDENLRIIENEKAILS